MKFTFLKICLLSVLIYSPTIVAQTIRVGSWNIEWLSTQGVDKFEASNRRLDDFNALADYASQLNSSVIAIQEVNDINAAAKVFGEDYTIVLSERANSNNASLQFNDINQYTGFALHNSVTLLSNPDDLRLESTPQQKLRFATYIIVEQQQQPLHLLSVHLKAGCPTAKQSNRSCKILEQQAEQLNRWMAERIDQQQAFAVVGDFNHNMAYKNDWLFGRLTAGLDGKVTLDTQNTPATCEVRSTRNPNQTHRYRYLIDHMLSYKLKKHSPAIQQNYASKDVTTFQLSDHCPVYTDYHLSP